METSSFARSTRSWRIGEAALALVALVAPGCADHVVPIIRAIPAARSKPGDRYETLVALPNRGLASVYLHFLHVSGRIAITAVGVVNHYPDRATVFTTRTRVFVDDGPPLAIMDYQPFDSKTRLRDARIAKKLPPDAAGKWLIPKRRFVSRKTIRGPHVVLLYTVKGYEGFVKVPYRTRWGVPGQ